MKKVLKAEMTWKRVIILSLLSAVVTALLNCVPLLEGTSFANPAESLEIWVVLALYIIMNCRNCKEAMIKTFVFFLVSQPLIYLIEVPFKAAGWSLFRYYKFWAIMTVLTIPGAAIAYRVKKGDILAALILSVANGLIIFTGLERVGTVIDSFPKQLLAVIFCMVVPFLLITLLLRQKKSRRFAVILAIVIILAGLFTQILFPPVTQASSYLGEGDWSLVSVSGSGLSVGVQGDTILLGSRKNGTYTVTLLDGDGVKKEVRVVVEGSYHYIRVGEPKDIE